MDLKTSPEKMGLLVPHINDKDFINTLSAKVRRTAELLSAMDSSSREFRTVLVPPLVSASDIPEMTAILPKDASWQFAQFRNEGCIDPKYTEISPYTQAEAESIVRTAAALIPGAVLR